MQQTYYASNFFLLFDLIRSFLRQKGFIKKTPVAFFHYKTKEGLIFTLRKDVWDSAVIIENCWLRVYTRRVKELSKNPIIIDVGAHIGSFAILAGAAWKNSQIFAFEPSPDNFSLLLKNIRANHLEKQIFPFQLAVGKEGAKGEKLVLHPDNFGMHSTVLSYDLPGKQTKSKQVDVKTMGLNEIFTKNRLSYCDLIKFDCEGCEYPVISSASSSVLQMIKHIVMEYHDGGDIKTLVDLLKKAGFMIEFYQALPLKFITWIINLPLIHAMKSTISK